MKKETKIVFFYLSNRKFRDSTDRINLMLYFNLAVCIRGSGFMGIEMVKAGRLFLMVVYMRVNGGITR